VFELERISKEAIPGALEKAERYRLLNEPLMAESICLDVLEVESENQAAIVMLILALSDQFSYAAPSELAKARDLVRRLTSEYDKAYYAGILAERRATALLEQGGGQRGHVAYELYREAMDWYEQAKSLAKADHNDPTLRWNTCARLIKKYPHVCPAPEDPAEHMLE
jgi:hypothetical protein